MAALWERITSSAAASHSDYLARISDGRQPAPPVADLHPYLAFLDYRNTDAIMAVNVAYLVAIGALYMWMKDREKPFSLRGPMLVYNAVCVALAAYVVVGVVNYQFAEGGGSKFVCNKPDFSPAGRKLSHVVWVYYAQKFLEFGDTVFFVLRKSFRQLTPLHLYHHVSITVVTALFLRYDVNGDDYLAALLNSFVHVLMYSHYLLAAFKIDTWWKRQLTSLQLVQFTMVLAQTSYAFFLGGASCGSPDWLKVLMIVYQVTMLMLFGLFYLASYGKKGASKKGSKKEQ